MHWYYTIKGASIQSGMGTLDELLQMARDGRLKPTDLIWEKDGAARWVPASTLGDVFPKPPAPRGHRSARGPGSGGPAGVKTRGRKAGHHLSGREKAVILSLLFAAVAWLIQEVVSLVRSSNETPQAGVAITETSVRTALAPLAVLKRAQVNRIMAGRRTDEIPELNAFFSAAEKGDWAAVSNAYAQVYAAMPAGASDRKLLQGPLRYPVDDIIKAHKYIDALGPDLFQKLGRDILQAIPDGVLLVSESSAEYLAAAAAAATLRYTKVSIVQRDLLRDPAYGQYLQAAQSGRTVPISGSGRVDLQPLLEANLTNAPVYVTGGAVEEWMMPRLEPNGPLLRLNRDALPALDQHAVNADLAFWEGNVNLLIGYPGFRTNAMARSLFAGLRLGGARVYAHHDFTKAAERAYRDVLLLSPANTNASVGLTALLLKQNRFAEADDLAQKTRTLNPRGADVLLRMVAKARADQEAEEARLWTEKARLIREGSIDMATARDVLEASRRLKKEKDLLQLVDTMVIEKSTLTPAACLSLAYVCAQLRQLEKADVALAQFSAAVGPDTPSESITNAARLWDIIGQPGKSREFLDQTLDRRPEDGRLWLELAAVRSAAGETRAALKAFRQAAKYTPDLVRQLAPADIRFEKIREESTFKRYTE